LAVLIFECGMLAREEAPGVGFEVRLPVEGVCAIELRPEAVTFSGMYPNE